MRSNIPYVLLSIGAGLFLTFGAGLMILSLDIAGTRVYTLWIYALFPAAIAFLLAGAFLLPLRDDRPKGPPLYDIKDFDDD